jgi:hypothetical protein
LHQARQVGATPSAQQVQFGVLLSMRDQAGAEAKLQAISDPTSASYGQWMSNAGFDATYAPANADVAAVQSWLRSQGFKVNNTLPGGMLVQASGPAAQVEQTFGVQLNDYSYQGKTVRSNATALSLPASTPAAVSGAIAGVIGVDQGSALKQPADTEPGPPPGARYGVRPCSDYYGQKTANDKPPAYGRHQPYAVCGYVPQQYQSAYGESGLLGAGVNGRGVTVAITDAYAAPTIYQDAQKYNQVHCQPQFTRGQFTQITPEPTATTTSMSAMRRAGTERRPSTWRPCTRCAWGQDRLCRRCGLPERPRGCLGQRDRQSRRRRDHELLDRRYRRHQPARLRLRRVLCAVLTGGGAHRDHGELLLRGRR